MSVHSQLKAYGLTAEQISRCRVDGRPVATEDAPGSSAYRSKAEAMYAAMLADDQRAGRIVAWLYEPMRFRIGKGAWYTPDFFVVTHDLPFELHEVKGGFVREAARVRFLAAQQQYPWFVWKMVQRTRHGWQNIE